MRRMIFIGLSFALAACGEASEPAGPQVDANIEAASEAVASSRTIDIGEIVEIESVVLGETRQLFIHTPSTYNQGDRSYPVLYLTDAGSHFDHTVATTGFLGRQGRMPEMIIVGVTNTDRTRDLTPGFGNPAAGDIWDPERFEEGAAGGADNFLLFFETEMIPFIEENYRTAPYRVFAGHSLGGLFAVHTLVAKPDLFDAIIAVSPSVWWDAGEQVTRLEAFLEGRDAFRKSFYFALGSEGPDMQKGFEGLEAALSAREIEGLDWANQQLPAEDHGSVVLRSHYLAFEHIFGDWKAPEDTLSAGLDAVTTYYADISDKFGYTVNIPAGVIFKMAFEELGSEEDGAEARAFAMFDYNLVHYPNSPQIFFVTALAHEQVENLDAALEYFEQSLEVALRIGEADVASVEAAIERVRALLAEPAPEDDADVGGE